MSLYQVGDDGRVSVHGNLNRDTLAKDWWVMLSAGEKKSLTNSRACLIDLANVERVDSAGLAWIVNALRDARANGLSVSLTDVPEKLHQLAKISSVDTLLPVQ